MLIEIHHSTLKLGFLFLAAAFLTAGCGGDDDDTQRNGPKSTKPLNSGELHIVPGSDATQADGSEQYPLPRSMTRSQVSRLPRAGRAPSSCTLSGTS